MTVFYISVSNQLGTNQFLISFIHPTKNDIDSWLVPDLSVQSFSRALLEFCRDNNFSILNPTFYAENFFGAEVILPINYHIAQKYNGEFTNISSPLLERIVNFELVVEELRNDQNVDPNSCFFDNLQKRLQSKFP